MAKKNKVMTKDERTVEAYRTAGRVTYGFCPLTRKRPARKGAKAVVPRKTSAMTDLRRGKFD